MKIQDILIQGNLEKKFKDNNGRIWKVIKMGGCDTKQTLKLVKDNNSDNNFIGYKIEDLFFLSDIVNLKFKEV